MIRRLAATLAFLACLVAGMPAAWAAITVTLIDTTNSKVAGTSIACTVPAAGVPAAATIFVGWAGDTTGTAFSVADSATNTYVQDRTQNFSGNVMGHLFSAKNVTALSSGNSITVSWTTNVAAKVVICAYATNLDATTPLDQTTSAQGTGTAISSGNITTTQASEVIIGVVGYENVLGAVQSDSNFTSDNDSWADATSGGGATSNIGCTMEARIVSATETQDYSPANSTSVDWVALIASYKEAGGAPPPTTDPGWQGGGWW